MKIRAFRIVKNAVLERFNNTSSVVLERKINVFKTVVDRNKLVAPATDNIDDIVAFAKVKKVQHKLYL